MIVSVSELGNVIGILVVIWFSLGLLCLAVLLTLVAWDRLRDWDAQRRIYHYSQNDHIQPPDWMINELVPRVLRNLETCERIYSMPSSQDAND